MMKKYFSLLLLAALPVMMQAQDNYQHLIMYGQSLSVGAQSYPLLTQNNLEGTYMIGNQIWINYNNSSVSALNPLKGSIVGGTPSESDMTRASGLVVECPLFSVANHLQRKTGGANKYLATSSGYHGRTIEQLSKGSNDAGLYNDFLKGVIAASNHAQNNNISISCPAIFWLQGENNYVNTYPGYTAGSTCTSDKEEYTTWLLRLKNDMQQDLMSRYSQAVKPLFITYQVGAQFIKNKEATISMAQLEASNKYRDIVCAGPVYPMTDRGGHLDPNGYRWYGEMMAKAYYKTLVSGEDFKPLQPVELSRTDNPNQLKVRFLVPHLPLVLDEKLVQAQTNDGFELYVNGTKKTITGVSVENDCVYLTASSSLAGKVEVVYAGQNTAGHGNLRDSDDYEAFDTYVDLDGKDSNGQYIYKRAATETSLRPAYEPRDNDGIIYGKPYPLYNFCVTFYYVLEANENSRTVPSLDKGNDYLQLIIYGQSLGMGWECPRAITTTAIDGNYMLGNSPLMKYNNGQTVLNPLTATLWEQGGEQPIVGCVNAFSQLYRENINPDQKFIGMTGGEGGQTIERLSKECTNSGFYASTFTKILDNTLSALPSGETVACPAIVYMQGEYNCNNSSWYGGRGLTPGSDGTTGKDEYKRLLLQLKNNMQADVMQKYGQTQKPLFFIYQTSGNYLKMKEMPIAMAQYEFAAENEDVVMLNPHYALPDYNGGHLSTNGYRWYGEMVGTTLYDVLLENKNYQPVYPENISIAGQTLTIDYQVPSPPLVLDTWTNTQAGNYGFVVYKDHVSVPVKSVAVNGNDKITITCDVDLSGKIEVVYAGNTTNGTGNVCDSYARTSLYTYFDDTADTKKESYTPRDKNGQAIYGQSYPMQNWSVGFYYTVDDSNPDPGFSGEGDGTINNPYQIVNAVQLNQVRNNLGAYYQLENDVDLTEWLNTHSSQTGWEPIGSGVAFTGSFNGNGHFITGLWSLRTTSDNTGLFSILTGAKISKLGVIVPSGKSLSGRQNTGIIAGQTTGLLTSIEQCYTSGDAFSAASNAGGIIGLNYGKLNLKQCYTNGNVSSVDGCGGILGNTYGASSNVVIEECYASNYVNGGGASAGGLLGGFSYSNSSVPASPIVTIKNSAAINPAVDGVSTSTARLTGYEKSVQKITYENNFAYDGLKINNTTVTSGTVDNKNGLNQTAEELIKQSTYAAWNFSQVWQMANGKYPLPVLKNIALSNQPLVNPLYLPETPPITGISLAGTGVVLYPNPTQGVIHIPAKADKAPVFVYDCTGNLLLSTGENRIDLSSFAKGIYFIKITEKVYKIIKQ